MTLARTVFLVGEILGPGDKEPGLPGRKQTMQQQTQQPTRGRSEVTVTGGGLAGKGTDRDRLCLLGDRQDSGNGSEQQDGTIGGCRAEELSWQSRWLLTQL